MGNRSMQAKVVKAKAQATEYAIQAGFRQLGIVHDKQVIDGKLIPRHEPQRLDDMVDDYTARYNVRHIGTVAKGKPRGISKGAIVRQAYERTKELSYAELRAIFRK